ncbi:MAG: hypothetical protein A4E32_00215 [Methanomassiliicoccales archaeon PtaU1.Bin124]|nr:MAG: hypothetical protein A4E32_00215 [Methanomassiliicoccales archaeon PtaU1.Bin124]
MSATPKDLRALTSKAEEMGASKASTILASSVIMDPRVELKCRIPLCPNYGRSLTCPPNVIGPERFALALGRYSHAVLVQKRYDQKEMMAMLATTPYQELESSPEYLGRMRGMFKDFAAIMSGLEGEAMRMGYRFAAALVGGPCCQCDECASPGQKCRHPFQARPSMEAMGIDVIATAASAQMAIEYPARDYATLTGLLLVE